LKNVIFKVAVNARQGKQEFGARDLPAAICGESEGSTTSTKFDGNLEDMERRMILQAMERNGGNQGKAALQLGISTRTLRRKLEKYRASEVNQSGQPLGKLSALQQRYYRVTMEIPVTVRDLDEGGEPVQAATANVSSGGIAVKSACPLRHGSTFEISLTLPGTSGPLEAKAKLAWASPGGLAGLSFVEIHPAVQKELQSWLLARADEEGWSGDTGASEG
jgi:hypothetical protein